MHVSTATRMYDKGFDEQLISEKTGHHSVAVRSYKRTSSKQLKEVCDVLYGNVDQSDKKVVKSDVTSTISKAPVPVESEVETEDISVIDQKDDKMKQVQLLVPN